MRLSNQKLYLNWMKIVWFLPLLRQLVQWLHQQKWAKNLFRSKNGFDGSIPSNWFFKILYAIHTSGNIWSRNFSLLGMHEMCNVVRCCSFKMNWIFRNTFEMNSNNNSSSSSRGSSIKQHRTGIILLKCVLLCCIVLGDFVCFQIGLCA